jgi:hypothetical protein
MSYVIHIFEHAGPATLAEADALHEQLSSTRASANPKFIQLAKALIKRFPHEVGGGEDGRANWMEDVPDGLTGGSAVYSLGLYDGGITQLLPAIVSVALPLGLCVYDDQAARCYVPGGFVLTHSGKRALGRAAPPEPTTPTVQKYLEPYTTEWTVQRIFKGVGAGIAHTGFVGRVSGSRVTFSRVTDAGLQHFGLTVSREVQVAPSVLLAPLLPHALYRMVRPGRTISCFASAGVALKPFNSKPNEVLKPGEHRWFKLNGSSKMDELAQALVQFFLEEHLPLLDACRDVPGIVRHERDRPALAAYVDGNRTVLALAHWLGQEDVVTYAEGLVERAGPEWGWGRGADIALECAQKLAALKQYKGAWRPLPAPCRLPTVQDALTQAELAKALLPVVQAVAVDHGFSQRDLGNGSYCFERHSAQVRQYITVSLNGDSSKDARVPIDFEWDSPLLQKHWKSVLAAEAQEGASLSVWEQKVKWDTIDFSPHGIDPDDINISIERRDELPDYLREFQTALGQVIIELLDPALTLPGLAAQLWDPSRESLMVSTYRTPGLTKFATQATLAGAFRPDWLETHGPGLVVNLSPSEQGLLKIVEDANLIASGAKTHPFSS